MKINLTEVCGLRNNSIAIILKYERLHTMQMSRVATLAQDLDFALTSGSLIYIFFLLLSGYDGRALYTNGRFFFLFAATQYKLKNKLIKCFVRRIVSIM